MSGIASDLPKLDPRYQQEIEVDGYIYANDGKTILSVLRGSESRILLEPDEIAPVMKQAIVAVEDKRFYEHRGIDLRGIARAAWADIRNKAVVEGGSTITQQFVKNAYVKNERSIARKVKEAALAWQLEQRWKKDDVLTAYLNTIYFGNGAYGIQQAAVTYFGHGAGARTLELHEAALLAGIPADPSRYDPVANPEDARARRDLVLRKMLEQKDISRRDYLAATAARLPRADDIRQPGIQGPAPYFGNYVKQQLIDMYQPAGVYGRGLRVRTTIDLDLQRLAAQAISKWLTNPEGPSAALVALDPRNGEVLAMIGGDYRESEFNLAAQAQRQPGSAFKPFVLATALEQGIAPSSVFNSRQLSIPLGDRFWSVNNYDDVYLGPISLETATIHSDNAVYAELTRLVGPAAVVKTAHRLGIRSPLNKYLAIGLGAEAVNPLELARAFAPFANGGYRIDGSIFGNAPRVVVGLAEGPSGRMKPNSARPRRVLTRGTSRTVTALLQKVVSQGTGRHAALADRPAAGKTGTTENYGDAWFVGYTPQLVTAVWVGYPNTLKPMLTDYHGEPVAGGTYPALIWKTFMENALAFRNEEPQYFEPPPSLYAAAKRVVWRDGRLMLDNGLCHGALQVAYYGGRGPTNTAPCKPNEVEVPRVVGHRLAAARTRLAAQPLDARIVYKPAKPLDPVGIVVDQYPERGRLSSYDEVTLVAVKPLDGVVPKLVGLTLREARARLRARGLSPRIGAYSDGPAGRVVAQEPRAGLAARRGMPVTLVVARG